MSLEEMESLRTDFDKSNLYCKRLLAKDIYEGNTLVHGELLTYLTQIQHTYYYLYKYSSEKGMSKDENVSKLLSELHDYLLMHYNAFYKKDLSAIHKVNKLKHAYQFGKCLELIEKSAKSKTVVFSYIRELFRLVQVSTSPLLTIYLESLGTGPDGVAT